MKKRIATLLLALLSIASLANIGISTSAFAEDNTTADDTANSLGVEAEQRIEGYLVASPVNFQLGVVTPGVSYTDSFTTANIGQEPVSFNLSVEPFGVINGSYDSVYSEPTNRTRLSEWIRFPGGTKYTMQPGEKMTISFQANIPLDAFGGGQYAAIMINLEPKESDGAFKINTRIALPVYSTIDGDITYSGKITDHSIQGFSFEPAIKSSSTIENMGNADFEATYKFTVTPLFANEEIVYEHEDTRIIIPETTRVYTQNWNDAPALGIFNAKQEISYIDESGNKITDTYKKMVFICPLWLIFIIFAILILSVVATIIKIKKQNQAKKNNKKPSWEQG